MPVKAIPPARDRLQSRLLVWLGSAILGYLSYGMIRYCFVLGDRFHASLSLAILISAFFALAAWCLRAATPLAAVFGGMVCLQLMVFSSRPGNLSPFRSGLTPLLLLFVFTFQATRMARSRKRNMDVAATRKGRNAAQVAANLGIAALSIGYGLPTRGPSPESHLMAWVVPLTSIPMLAALAEATADTVASEIGQAFGGTPFLLTTLRRVPPGTDGGVTALGTLAGIAAAAIVVYSAIPALATPREHCLVAFAAAVCGLFFDSLLGATVERKGWIGNDLVNLLSTAFSAAMAWWLAIRFL